MTTSALKSFAGDVSRETSPGEVGGVAASLTSIPVCSLVELQSNECYLFDDKNVWSVAPQSPQFPSLPRLNFQQGGSPLKAEEGRAAGAETESAPTGTLHPLVLVRLDIYATPRFYVT